MIFNSLGSNYSGQFVKLAMKQLIWPNQKAKVQLQQKLEKQFKGQAILVYKGRDAIELALRAYGIGPGDQVLIQAFSCYAIEEAIKRTKAEAVYVDLAKGQLNPGVKELQAGLKREPVASRPKAVLIQHTLGQPAEIKKIKKWCQANKLLLIEDLAQSFGATDKAGESLGTLADVVVLSFGRDKILDAVAGGAVIFKRKLKKIPTLSTQSISQVQVIKDMIYPYLTWKIRSSYGWGTNKLSLGKLRHWLAKKFGLLGSPTISPTEKALAMPNAYATLVLQQFQDLSQQLNHRRHLAKFYQKELKSVKNLEILIDKDAITHGVNLRVAIAVKQPANLIMFLAKKGLYLGDRWYKQAVDCGSHRCQTNYQANSCPRAEELAQQVVNLPTHREMTENKALKLAALIKEFLKKN